MPAPCSQLLKKATSTDISHSLSSQPPGNPPATRSLAQSLKEAPSLSFPALLLKSSRSQCGHFTRWQEDQAGASCSSEPGEAAWSTKERTAPGGLLTCRQRLSIRLPVLDGSSPHLQKPQADSLLFQSAKEMLTESGAGTGSLAAGKGLPAAPGSGQGEKCPVPQQGELGFPLPFSAAPKQSKT